MVTVAMDAARFLRTFRHSIVRRRTSWFIHLIARAGLTPRPVHCQSRLISETRRHRESAARVTPDRFGRLRLGHRRCHRRPSAPRLRHRTGARDLLAVRDRRRRARIRAARPPQSRAAASAGRRPRRWRVVLTGVGLAVSQCAYFAAVDDAGVAAATVVTIGASPLFVAVGAHYALRERFGRRHGAVTAVAVLGLVLLTGGSVSAPARPRRTRCSGSSWRSGPLSRTAPSPCTPEPATVAARRRVPPSGSSSSAQRAWPRWRRPTWWRTRVRADHRRLAAVSRRRADGAGLPLVLRRTRHRAGRHRVGHRVARTAQRGPDRRRGARGTTHRGCDRRRRRVAVSGGAAGPGERHPTQRP